MANRQADPKADYGRLNGQRALRERQAPTKHHPSDRREDSPAVARLRARMGKVRA